MCNWEFPGEGPLQNHRCIYRCQMGHWPKQKENYRKTFNNGSLGSRIDEERSELR
jgi:hypothetical protein